MTKGPLIPKDWRATEGFHGTDHAFEDSVLPGRAVPHKNLHYPGLSGADDTYFLPADVPTRERNDNENSAWGWTKNYYETEDTRRRVHVTRPIGQQHIDNNLHWGHGLPERKSQLNSLAHVAPAQEIKDTIWAPPPTDGGWVEQTLPKVNWHQFGGENWTQRTPDASLPDATKAEMEDHVYWKNRYPEPGGKVETPKSRTQLRGQQSLFY
jgi:hypothetical protein